MRHWLVHHEFPPAQKNFETNFKWRCLIEHEFTARSDTRFVSDGGRGHGHACGVSNASGCRRCARAARFSKLSPAPGMNLSRKEIFLVALVLVLGGSYIVFFSDWFKPRFIRIEHSVRSSREGWAGSNRVEAVAGAGAVTFALHKPYKLTSVQVVPLAEIQTNKYAHPVWHLISKEGSVPADGFAYGFPLQGMSPAVSGVEPEPLASGMKYRLLVEAGSLKGTNDFKVERTSSSGR
jgi:hypothetical protein